MSDAQQLKMDAIENKLDNIISEVKNLNNQDEDITGALNFLRILKG